GRQEWKLEVFHSWEPPARASTQEIIAWTVRRPRSIHGPHASAQTPSASRAEGPAGSAGARQGKTLWIAGLSRAMKPGRRMIVGGLLVRHGTLLLGKRSPQRTLAPNLWDVFGGHVEPGESAEAALVRELDEELGIRATHVTLLEALDDPHPFDGALSLFLV